MAAPVVVNPITGCWEYQGARNKKGYGVIKVKGVKYLSHRLSYMHSKGPIPKGMLVCHQCDNPCCANPDHLFLGTNRDNMRDMAAKGRGGRLKGKNHIQSKFIVDEDVAKALEDGIRDWDTIAAIAKCSYGYIIRYLRGDTWQKATKYRELYPDLTIFRDKKKKG